jgi:repressor LexA
MSSMSRRIKEIRFDKNLSQVKFAKALDVTSASISYYEAGKRQPDSAFLSKLCERYQVNLNWLLTGEGEMYQQLYEIDASILDDVITLPIVAEIAAGEPVEAILDEPRGHIAFPTRLLHFPPPYHVFSVKGKSMEPYIMNKDIVICSQDWRDVDLDGKIMAFRTADGITLKKMVIDVKNKITWLMPINHEFVPKPFDQDSEEIVMIGILDIAIRAYNRSH